MILPYEIGKNTSFLLCIVGTVSSGYIKIPERYVYLYWKRNIPGGVGMFDVVHSCIGQTRYKLS